MFTPHASDQTEMRPQSDYQANERPAEAVVTAVAEATGQSPLEMDPLGEVVDADALNTLFRSHENRWPSVTVSFEYCGERVTVTTDGIQVAPSDSPE